MSAARLDFGREEGGATLKNEAEWDEQERGLNWNAWRRSILPVKTKWFNRSYSKNENERNSHVLLWKCCKWWKNFCKKTSISICIPALIPYNFLLIKVSQKMTCALFANMQVLLIFADQIRDAIDKFNERPCLMRQSAIVIQLDTDAPIRTHTQKKSRRENEKFEQRIEWPRTHKNESNNNKRCENWNWES